MGLSTRCFVVMLAALPVAHGVAVAQPAPTAPTPSEAIAPAPDGAGSAATPLVPAPKLSQPTLPRQPIALTKQPQALSPKRYGHHVLLGDLATLIAWRTISQKADDDTVSAVVALSGINLAAPLIHIAHHNWSGAAWSFGLRATASYLTYLAYKAPCKDGPCGVGTFFVGGLGGVIVMSVDYFKLAKVARKPTQVKKSSVVIQPTLHIGPESTGFALAGSF
ncbi:MAG TPA: hypothetical protein PLF40_15695 [Kofleriaceae bacterium]|nr:hypothetical protein [Kofleriaceae bacterium]